jgi:hypothetical protein
MLKPLKCQTPAVYKAATANFVCQSLAYDFIKNGAEIKQQIPEELQILKN